MMKTRIPYVFSYTLHTNSVLPAWFSLLFVGLGTCAMVLLRQRCVKHHKILVRQRKQTIPKWLFPYRAYISDRKIAGKHERVFSDHFDFVAPDAFNGNVHPFQGCPKRLIPSAFSYRRCNRSQFSRGRSRTSLHSSSEFLSSLCTWIQSPETPGDFVFFFWQISHCLQPLSSTAQTWIKDMCLFGPLRAWRHRPVEINALLSSSFMQDCISREVSTEYQFTRS